MRTLVLNAGYEPLSVVSDRRALVLVLQNKATILDAASEFIHSATESFQRPVVILLHRYIRPPRPRVGYASRSAVLRRDHFRCAYCRGAANTVDHVIPRSRGGSSDWCNLVACCVSCNHRKGNKTLNQLGWQLDFTPAPPAHGVQWLKDFDHADERWQPYLAFRIKNH